MIDIDNLAQEIRRVDGSNNLGAGALAEALRPFMSAALEAAITAATPAVIERCAMVVESCQIKDSNAGQTVEPRMEGNRAGLAYAAAIRMLNGETK